MADRRLGVGATAAPARSLARPLSLSRGLSGRRTIWKQSLCDSNGVFVCPPDGREGSQTRVGGGVKPLRLIGWKGEKGQVVGPGRLGSVDKPAAGILSAETSAEVLQWFCF